MKYNPDIHHRSTIRLKGYDYSQGGLYFITICTQNRLCLFGKIVDGEMILNNAGKIIEQQWNSLINRFTHIQLHEFIIMPNHFHGIIQIVVGAGFPRPYRFPRPYNELSNVNNQNNYRDIGRGDIGRGDIGRGNRAPTTAKHTLGQIVAYFKYGTTKQINTMHNMSGTKIWQRNYYEHIIRDEKSYYQKFEYIQTNPLKWEDDKYYESNVGWL